MSKFKLAGSLRSSLLATALMFVGVGAHTTPYSDAVLANNPIAYWQFEETSGTTAVNSGSTGAANDGTYGSGVTLGQAGVSLPSMGGNAAEFSGADGQVTVPNFAGQLGPNITATLWLNSDSATWGNNDAALTFTPTNQFRLYSVGNSPQIQIRDSGGVFHQSTQHASHTVGQWYYYAIVATETQLD